MDLADFIRKALDADPADAIVVDRHLLTGLLRQAERANIALTAQLKDAEGRAYKALRLLGGVRVGLLTAQMLLVNTVATHEAKAELGGAALIPPGEILEAVSILRMAQGLADADLPAVQ